MALSVVAVTGHVDGSGGTQPTFTKPTGLAVGDLMVVGAGGRGTGAVTKTGWTATNYSTFPTHSNILYRIADAADVAASNFVFTAASGAGPWVGSIFHITGADTTTPLDTSIQTNTGTSSTPTQTGITTVTDNTVLLHFMMNLDTNFTSTIPSGYTEGDDEVETAASSLFCRHHVSYKTQAAAGATGTVAGSLSSSSDWTVGLVAIRPAVVGGTSFVWSYSQRLGT